MLRAICVICVVWQKGEDVGTLGIFYVLKSRHGYIRWKGREGKNKRVKSGWVVGVGEGGKEIRAIAEKRARTGRRRLVDEGGNSRALAGTVLGPKGVGGFCN